MTDLVSVNSNQKQPLGKIRRGKNERSPPRKEKRLEIDMNDVVITPVKAQFPQSSKNKPTYQPIVTQKKRTLWNQKPSIHFN